MNFAGKLFLKYPISHSERNPNEIQADLKTLCHGYVEIISSVWLDNQK